MKKIILTVLSIGLTSCQINSSFTAENISKMSNEELCRALGTHNHQGELILKIHDELQRRPEKIDAEKCFALEKMKSKETDFRYPNQINTIKIPEEIKLFHKIAGTKFREGTVPSNISDRYNETLGIKKIEDGHKKAFFFNKDEYYLNLK